MAVDNGKWINDGQSGSSIFYIGDGRYHSPSVRPGTWSWTCQSQRGHVSPWWMAGQGS
ncbi:hypothetical protein SAMD00019534_020650, partial [Acytostelium subglobosum LB1]|uniref:hypothetical protein n=1 Tax=Acytostelium subglobosum LB1 TaxID=1410327 RepID=UPI0006447C3D